MREFHIQIISGILAGLTFALLSVFSNFIFLFNLMISISVGLGLYLSIPKMKDPSEMEIVDGIKKSDFDKALKKIDDHIVKFRKLKEIDTIRADKILDETVELLELIRKEIENDPSDLFITEQFINQYLDRSFRIMNQYVNILSSESVYLEENLKGIEEVVKQIPGSFRILYQKCIDKDLQNLMVDSEVFKTLIELDI